MKLLYFLDLRGLLLRGGERGTEEWSGKGERERRGSLGGMHGGGESEREGEGGGPEGKRKGGEERRE